MRACERCGVSFDSAGQWCIDCLEVENVVDLWSRQSHGPEAAAQKTTIITDLWRKNLSDPQIAKILGVAVFTVLRWRKRLNLPATNHGGYHMMNEAAKKAQLARIPLMVERSLESRRKMASKPAKKFW